MKEIILDDNFLGDFGTCKKCGKDYTIYGSNGMCDDCRIDEYEGESDAVACKRSNKKWC